MTQNSQVNGYSLSQLLFLEREASPLEVTLGAVPRQLSGPFNVITNAAWSLKDECSAEDREFWIECILRNALPAQNLIEDLQDQLRWNNGQFEIRPEKMDLSKVVSEAIEEFGPLAREYQIRFYGDTAWVLADRERIKRLVFNLLSNAIHNSRLGRVIKVDVWKRTNRVCLFIQDQGQVEKPNESEQMFSSFIPFDQESGTLPLSNPGLCSVKRIADAHAAAIRVQGTPGEGTIFEVEFQSLETPNSWED